MSDQHDFKIVNREIRRSYSEDEQTAANVRSEIGVALEALAQFEADSTVEDRAMSLAVAYNALVHLDRWIPKVPEAFACGYYWGRDGDHWSTFSAHATHEEAEAWLPYWREKLPRRTEWVIEQRAVPIGDFVMGGPPA